MQAQRITLKEFVRKYGEPYSRMLGIDLESKDDGEIVKWFLASILYSKPVRESSATKTYRCFERHGLLTAEKILGAGWERLVAILDEGGYTRYDFSTADKLLAVFGNLQQRYEGSLNMLHDTARDASDLEQRMRMLGKGIGDTTISIFLRDMRGIWPKARPKPSPLVGLVMRRLGIRDLESTAREMRVSTVRLETALLRLEKDFIRKGRRLQVVK